VSLTLPPAERLGAQRPRLLHVPEFVSSTGEEACELAAMAGLEMDPWQQFVLTNGLGEQPDGLWAAKEVGVEVPRQNGKGGILEARALAGLFLLGEKQIIHSAHEFATAEEALNRMEQLIDGCPTCPAALGRSSIRTGRRASTSRTASASATRPDEGRRPRVLR
jgi:phage terminase large subunit-like protein